MKYSTATIGTLKSLLFENKKPVLLLGAGCSIKSGIPTASEFVDKAAKWGYAREKGLPAKEVSIRRSDWFPWLTSQHWYRNNLSAADNYPYVVENLLQPKAIRRAFLRDVLNPQVPPSIGYEKLADLIGLKVFHTILTTNFDNLIAISCNSNRGVHGHQLIKNSDELVKISTNPDYAQIVHLHGDIETYTDKNLMDETASLDVKLVERLNPILRDNPLVIIGYRGAEDSIMKSLLLSQISKTDNFPNGIYWCHYDKSSLHEIPQNVVDLSSAIGSNFQLIKTPSFDDIMRDIWYDYSHKISPTPVQKGNNQNPPTIHDLTMVKIGDWSFDLPLHRKRIFSYCESLNVYKPTELSDDWINQFNLERDLTVQDGSGKIFPTFAGFVLFGEKIQSYKSSIGVEVTVQNNKEWLDYIFHSEESDSKPELDLSFIINGNLWEQLEEVLDILSQFNKSFRLKGEVSRDVMPYPPLALKELIVNALVHRDYEIGEAVRINITPHLIEISNPGGITRELQGSLHNDSILSEISKGKRGFKSYRNPVIADFFYGGGAMDKAGSGLADVYEQVLEYNSKVLFGPDEDNRNFRVQVYARPESIDSITRTAKGEIGESAFVANMLEIIQMPEWIYTAYCTEIFDRKQFWENHRGLTFPPFESYHNDLIQFYPFQKDITPLANYVEPSLCQKLTFWEFEEMDGSRKTTIKLLNKSIQAHLESLGLVVDWKRQRAYFPKEVDSENRTVSYQARIKKATRTVAKRIINKKSEEVMYWEHKSVNYQIKKFDDVWVLVLLPGYVFTVDGNRWLVKSEKISRLATKRSAIDYNKSVLNDLYFWLDFISLGEDKSFYLQFDKNKSSNALSQIKISSQYPKLKTNRFQDYDSLEGFEYEDLDVLENEVAHEINQIKRNDNN